MEEIRLGSCTLEVGRQLLNGGERVPIGKRALDIISVLGEAGGKIVTKDELLAAVWPGVTIEENALQVHIVALRKALGPEAERLKTIRGVGYQLKLEHGETDEPGPPGARPQTAASPQRHGGETPSILVLPFDNMSGDHDQVYFADGISEDIITDLAKVSALQVISRNTAFSFRRAALTVTQIGQSLQATHVLEGSVRRSGERVRVTAQLIETASGNSVWAERYDRRMSDIFDIQDELSAAIVNALKVKLLPQERREIESRGTRNVDAYDYYLRARALRATMNLEQIPLSLHAYRTALELDPDFALAWAGLASSLIQNRLHFPDNPDITETEIDHALERASLLAPNSADVIAGFAQRAVFDRDWAAAAQCLRRLQASGDASWSICSHILLILGRANEAALQQEKVRRADPLSIGSSWALQFHYACAQRFDDAAAEYERSKVLTGGMPAMRWEAIKRHIAMGQQAGARAEFLEAAAEGNVLMPFASLLADAMDNGERPGKVLRAALANPECLDQISRSRIADCAILTGEIDLAFEALRSAFVDARGIMIIELWHPIASSLRQDPRFKQIVIDIGLADYWRQTGEWGEFARPLGSDDFELI